MHAVLRVSSKTVLAPAKLNLTLEVLGRRSDGYHRIRSVMVPVGLCDRLDLRPAAGALTFTCSDATLERGNLVVQACERLGITSDVAIHLEKNVPTGAGLGGGSSDAAAILLAAQRSAFGALAPLDWLASARALGSDVPFFLCETGALVEGTGERVTPLGKLPDWWAVIVHPDVFVATAEAYAQLDASRHEPSSDKRMESRSVRAGEALQRADFDGLVREIQNDFTTVIAARYSTVREALAALRAAGASHASLSGSGSAVFSLARDRAEADSLMAGLPPPLGARAYVAPLQSGAGWRNGRE